MEARAAAFRVGTSGYQYEHWRGVFYPDGLAKRRWFAHYAAHFDAVEINNTFYRLPSPGTFDRWREAAVESGQDFCYALKLSRYATHVKRLLDADEVLAAFLERARRLEDLLGPILVQPPPRWKARPERLARFLDAAPRDVRWAVEVRDESWLRREVYDALRDHDAALCIHDLLDEHPLEVTADWLYVRYHGPIRKYAGSYDPVALVGESNWIREHLAEGRDIFAFFNNDAAGHAVRNALELRERVERRAR